MWGLVLLHLGVINSYVRGLVFFFLGVSNSYVCGLVFFIWGLGILTFGG